jgi:hypothetical protein
MHCRRQEVELYDPAADQGASPQPMTPDACNRAGITLGAQFDISHADSPWRFWRSACPVPIINEQTGEIVAWKLPECDTKHGTIVCDQDTAI